MKEEFPSIKIIIPKDKKENKEFLGKKLSSDAELIMWLSSDDNNKKVDIHNLKFPFTHIDSKIKDKDFHKLIKIAKQCELFYKHKCKNEYIIKSCINCSEIYFHSNDLLRFINIEIFLYYMKYIFLISNDILAYSKKNFNNNKRDLEDMFNNLKKTKQQWKFNEPKIICKQCMFKLINKPNFCENIKEIFFKNKKLYEDKDIELNEEKSFSDYNNEKSNKQNETNKKNIINSNNINREQKLNYDSNIIIKYNNPNNNVYNTVIFNNNLATYPLILNNFVNDLQYKNANYIELLFISLKLWIYEIINISDSYKKNKISKIDCLTKVQLLNQNINNCFNLLQNSIKNNLYYLYKLIFKYNTPINNDIVFCIVNNKNVLDLLNFLLLKFLCIENNFIGIIVQ